MRRMRMHRGLRELASWAIVLVVVIVSLMLGKAIDDNNVILHFRDQKPNLEKPEPYQVPVTMEQLKVMV